MSAAILIIAAERGLGLGLAVEFLQRGWSVTGTMRPGTDASTITEKAADDLARLSIGHIDVTDADGIAPFLTELRDATYDVKFSNAGIYGPEHQSVIKATDAEFAEIMLTNTFGPVRLAHRLLDRLKPEGTLCFMSSHRGSIAINSEGGLELYRASKAALNMLARGIWSTNRARNLTVLSIHPGWVSTAMGTLNGTVPRRGRRRRALQGIGRPHLPRLA